MLRRASLLLVLMALLSACQGRGSQAGMTVRDSAGVQLLENTTPTWRSGEGWTVDARPSLTLGIDEGDPLYQFHRVSDALRLPDGTIVVSNTGSGELRMYTTDGKYIRSVGRPGQGPGEFNERSSLRLCQITPTELVVGDDGGQRVHVFTNAGEYQRSHTLERVPGGGGPNVRDCFGDGSLLVVNGVGGFRPGNPGSIIQSKLQYRRYELTGKPTTPIAEVHDRPRVEFLFGGMTGFPYVPLTAASAAAPGKSSLYVTYGGAPQIERRSLEGVIQAILRWPSPGRVASADVYDRYKDEVLQSISDPQTRVREANFYRLDLPIPDSVPVVQSMRVDDLGNLWVERYRIGRDSLPRHDVFDAEGKWLGQVGTPPRTEVFRIGRDYLLGRHRDELGVERIVLHRLTRRL